MLAPKGGNETETTTMTQTTGAQQIAERHLIQMQMNDIELQLNDPTKNKDRVAALKSAHRKLYGQYVHLGAA